MSVNNKILARSRSILASQAKSCGANAVGGGGFQSGNSCASGGGGGSSKQKPLSHNSKVGDSFKTAKYGAKEQNEISIVSIEGQEAKIKSDSGMTAIVPVESLDQLYSDTTGDYSYLSQFGESKSKEVNKIIAGEATFLGKGADGVVHDVGDDMVVKSSTTVPYHATGGGRHLTVNEAVDSFAAKVNLEKEMHAAGIPGVMKTRNGMHGDKIFSIRPKLDVEAKLSDSQLSKVEESLKAMHEAGYSVNDEIQVGIDKDGNVFHFDLGQASSGATAGDKKDDMGAFRRLKEQNEKRKQKSLRRTQAKGCGANGPGGDGFQSGNTCASGGGGGGGGTTNKPKKQPEKESIGSRVKKWFQGEPKSPKQLESKLAESLTDSNLSKADQFKKAVEKAASRMPEAAAKLAMEGVKKVEFFDTARDLTKRAIELHPEMSADIPEGSVIAGLFTEKGQLLLNGGKETGDNEDATHGTYLHELVHAMDPDDKVAFSDDWLLAWGREMRKGQLTEYGASSPVEGLAEFGRVLYDNGDDAVREAYPKAYSVFKSQGWTK